MSFYNKQQDDNLSRYRSELEPIPLDLLSMRSIAQDILCDQIQAQAIAKNMINNAVGVGDPSLVAISKSSQDISTKELPVNQYKEREYIIQEGTYIEKEEVLHLDKEFETENNQEQLGIDVFEGVPPAPPIVEPQQQKSYVQEQAEQDKIEDLQAQVMIRMNDAINYKLGSLDWGLNSLNAVQFPEKIANMRISDKILSYIQMNKVLSKVEKVNQSQLKMNSISEKQMITRLEAQKEIKKKYGKKSLKKKTKKST
ncbi:MAG: hypothetical protein EZS28_036055 [Streblomastix strix]|uniref:Uncharacterized protein n=1 Tax=Streblomastix strix TaxID=222440 RepID=A0A5J4UD07_9EUKA|nr:MAG: hypothetical protein EZS28_036055 [Streblomastix strix]